jgi:KaiC/GvpD/RAD55 family RecA-like ATPase
VGFCFFFTETKQNGFAVFENGFDVLFGFRGKNRAWVCRVFFTVSVKKTQQMKQDHKIYAIIITTNLNKEDENIRQIIERHLRKKELPEIRGICFNCS